MPDTFKIEKRDGYIHVLFLGPRNDIETSRAMFRKMVEVCKEHGCYKVLGESFALVPLSTQDAFQHAEMFQEVGITLEHKIAWVTHDPDVAKRARFAEAVLKARGLVNGHLFDTLDQATSWLFA